MSQPRWGFGKKSTGGTGTVTNVSSTDVTNLAVATPTTTPKITVKNAPTATSAKAVPDTALVAGTRITLATTAGKAKITAAAPPTLAGDVTGAPTANVVAKVPDTALVAGTRITLATVTGKAKISSNGTGIITAETSATGVTLINGTQTILSVTAPNDGKVHILLAASSIKTVSSAITGGATGFRWKALPTTTQTGGTTANTSVSRYTQNVISNNIAMLIKPNTVASFVQSTAMTAGAAKVYAKIVII